MLIKMAARQYATEGIRVNVIVPGYHDTSLVHPEQKKDIDKLMINLIPMGRAGKPAEMKGLAVWLASDASANVNGRTFFVQSGRISLYSEPVQERMIVKNGGFTIDELFDNMPLTLAAGLVNPYPPEKPKE